MRRIRAATALLVLLALAASAEGQRIGPRQVDSLPSTAPTHVARYGAADTLQFGHLRLPSGAGPFPVAVVIHGGCWTKGFATLRNTAAVASALLEDGIATWNLEYRQVGDSGGGWPNTFLDVGAGVDHLRTLAGQYPLDLNRVVLVGHSAGAHLALWAAGRHRLPAGNALGVGNPLPVLAAVAIDGPGDLRALVGPDARICGRPVIAGLMGGIPDSVPARYRSGSPREMLPLGVRQYLVSATMVLPAADAAAYEAAARAAGDSAAVLLVTEGGHFGVIAPGTPAWQPVRAFIRQALGLPPR